MGMDRPLVASRREAQMPAGPLCCLPLPRMGGAAGPSPRAPEALGTGHSAGDFGVSGPKIFLRLIL